MTSLPIDPPLMLETGHCLDTGRARADNQDNLIVVKGPAEGTWLLAVADGVGGLPGGAAASDTALATMESAVRDCTGPPGRLRRGRDRYRERGRYRPRGRDRRDLGLHDRGRRRRARQR